QRSPAGPAATDLALPGGLGVGSGPRPRAGEHAPALGEPDDGAPVRAHEPLRDHPRPRRDIEDAVARAGADRVDHRPAPAWILAEAEQRGELVVAPRQALEELDCVLLAGA